MSGRSSISRAEFYRISDMNKQEVFDYLDKTGVDIEIRQKCYDFTGGRINHLKMFVSKIVDDGLSFEGNSWLVIVEAQKIVLETIGSKLLQSWKGIEKSYRPTCKKILMFGMIKEFFRESEITLEYLVKKNGPESQKTTLAFVDDIEESLQALVNANILSYIGSNTYTLHSKVEKQFLIANLDEMK